MIHSLRVLKSRRRGRRCDSCGGSIGVGVEYVARNSSLEDGGGRRVYGFFSTHPECEWMVTVLGHGIGVGEDGVSYPGWLPEVLCDLERSDLLEIDGWENLDSRSRGRFLRMSGKGRSRRSEYRYYDPETKERSCFKATLDEVRKLVGG